MGKSEVKKLDIQAKGRRGQLEARKVLEGFGYTVDELNSGTKSGDFIARDDETSYLVEVKNQKLINIPVFLKQARENAKVAKMNWMLMCKIDGGWGWLVMKEGDKPAEIWS